MVAPLPPHWQELLDDVGDTYYYNPADDTRSYDHPADAYFCRLLAQLRGDADLQARAAAVVWLELIESSGKVFYHNFRQDVSQTEEPSGAGVTVLSRRSLRGGEAYPTVELVGMVDEIMRVNPGWIVKSSGRREEMRAEAKGGCTGAGEELRRRFGMLSRNTP